MPNVENFYYAYPSDVSAERITGAAPTSLTELNQEYLGNDLVTEDVRFITGSLVSGDTEGWNIASVDGNTYYTNSLAQLNFFNNLYAGVEVIKRKLSEPSGQFRKQPKRDIVFASQVNAYNLSLATPLVNGGYTFITDLDNKQIGFTNKIIGRKSSSFKIDGGYTPTAGWKYVCKSDGYFKLLGFSLPYQYDVYRAEFKNVRQFEKIGIFLGTGSNTPGEYFAATDSSIFVSFDGKKASLNFTQDCPVTLPMNSVLLNETADTVTIGQLVVDDLITYLKLRVVRPVYWSAKKDIIYRNTLGIPESLTDWYADQPLLPTSSNNTFDYYGIFFPCLTDNDQRSLNRLPITQKYTKEQFGKTVPAMDTDFYDGDYAVCSEARLTTRVPVNNYIFPLYDEMPDKDYTDFFYTGADPCVYQGPLGSSELSQAICITGGGTYWWSANSITMPQVTFNQIVTENSYFGETMERNCSSPGAFEVKVCTEHISQNARWNTATSSYIYSPIPTFNSLTIYWIQDGVEYSWVTGFDGETVWQQGTPSDLTHKKAFKTFTWEDIKAQGPFNPWTCHLIRFKINVTVYGWDSYTQTYTPYISDITSMQHKFHIRLGGLRTPYPYDIKKSDGTISRGVIPLELKNQLDTEFATLPGLKVSTGQITPSYDSALRKITLDVSTIEDTINTNQYFFDDSGVSLKSQLVWFYRLIDEDGNVYVRSDGPSSLSTGDHQNLGFDAVISSGTNTLSAFLPLSTIPTKIKKIEIVAYRYANVVCKNWCESTFLSGTGQYGLSWNTTRYFISFAVDNLTLTRKSKWSIDLATNAVTLVKDVLY